jgi:hypothetical protein
MRSITRFRRLPLELKIALFAMITAFILNVIWALNQTSWKIDPGTATLFGAVIGLAIIGQQAKRGFTNLIKSQRNQSELDREARLHQVELDQLKQTEEEKHKLNSLANALWGEVYALYFQVSDVYQANIMFAKIAEAMAKQRTAPFSKKLAFPAFDAPVYKANITNLGLLPPGIAADVILVMTRAKGGENHTIEQETPISHDMAKTLHSGFADTLKDWRDDLLHVSKRLSSIINQQTLDPGSLYDAQQARKNAAKNKSA